MIKELVIVSGKGGTGKTSIVGSLASLAPNKVMVDCDVDAADLHLLLNNKIIRASEFIGGKQASIDKNKCSDCGLCIDYCRFNAIRQSGGENPNKGQYSIDKLACDGCAVCVHQCPEHAIELKNIVSGESFVSETNYGPLVHARLGIAQANSGKLVSLLRRQARLLAEKNNNDLIIVDGPPGIGCPVIASISGADFILLVTEPSLSALHDLKRILELTIHFKVPSGICINRYDVNFSISAEIETYAKDKNIELLGKIPFDLTVTRAQLEGQAINEYTSNKVTARLEKLWKKLYEQLENASAKQKYSILSKI